jgi:pyruvate-formate lyase-activating enzyme
VLCRDEARKLTFSVDTNGTVVVSDQELANDNVNVTSVDIKIVTDDGYAPTTETLAGKLHIIDGVLLPTVEMLTLKGTSGQEAILVTLWQGNGKLVVDV